MDTKEIKELAATHLAKQPSDTTKVYLDKVRKNLIMLLCQSDTIELTGSVAAFGGEKDVEQSISRAIFSLFCAAQKLGVNVDAGLGKLVAALGKSAVSETPDVKPQEPDETATPATRDAHEPVATPAETKKEPPKQDPPSSTSSPAGDSKAKKLEMYKTSFSAAKGKEAVDKTWKDIIGDKELSGPDKAQLQNEKKAALERLAA